MSTQDMIYKSLSAVLKLYLTKVPEFQLLFNEYTQPQNTNHVNNLIENNWQLRKFPNSCVGMEY